MAWVAEPAVQAIFRRVTAKRLTRRAAPLSVRERMLLFCVASATDWQWAGITSDTVACLVVRGLLVRDERGRLMLTDRGRNALRALLPGL